MYLGKQQPKEAPKAEPPNAKAATSPEPVEWGEFLLLLMRTLMPFPDARHAVLAAIEAYEAGSP